MYNISVKKRTTSVSDSDTRWSNIATSSRVSSPRLFPFQTTFAYSRLCGSACAVKAHTRARRECTRQNARLCTQCVECLASVWPGSLNERLPIFKRADKRMKRADLSCKSRERSSLPAKYDSNARAHVVRPMPLSIDTSLSLVRRCPSHGKSSLIGSRDYFAGWTSIADFRLYASFRDLTYPAGVSRLPIATCSVTTSVVSLLKEKERERESSLDLLTLSSRDYIGIRNLSTCYTPTSRDYSSI